MMDLLNRMLVRPNGDVVEVVGPMKGIQKGRVVASRPWRPRYPAGTSVSYLWHKAADKRVGGEILHLVPEKATVTAVWHEWPGAE